MADERFLWVTQQQNRACKQNTNQINSSNTHSSKGCLKIQVFEAFQVLEIYELSILSKPLLSDQ